HRAQRQGGREGTTAGGQAKGSDSASALPGCDPGSHRRQDYRARKCFGIAQKRDREMLRRRYHAETEVARETERRKKADEKHRADQYPPGSLHRGFESSIT